MDSEPIPPPPMLDVHRPYKGELLKAQIQFLFQERQSQEDSLAKAVPPKPTGSDNDVEEADDLSFLADFPTPLTMRQRNDLLRHTDTAERNFTRIKRAYDVLQRRVTGTRDKKVSCTKRLAELANGVGLPTASLAPVLGAKRDREDTAPVAPAPAVPKRPQIGMKKRIGQPAPSRGGFGALQGALAVIQKESQATVDLQQQRQAVRNKAEQDALHQELKDVELALVDDEVNLADLDTKLAIVVAKCDALGQLVLRMEEEEATYSAAFTLTASGSWSPPDDAPVWAEAVGKVGLGNALPGEKEVQAGGERQVVDRLSRFGVSSDADAAKLARHVDAAKLVSSIQAIKDVWCGAQYSIPFSLAQNTDDTRQQIVAQIEKALPRYLAFRDEADPHLVEIDQVRAENEERRRQHVAEEDDLGEEEPFWGTEVGVHPLLDLEATVPHHSPPAAQGVLPFPEPEGGAVLEDAPFDY